MIYTQAAQPESLVQQAAHGNVEAFGVLVRENEQLLFSVAAACFQDPGDRADAVQEALLTAWHRIGTLREEPFFRTWLVRILINRCKSILRKKRPLPLEEGQAARLAGPSADAGPRLDVHRALARLDEKTRLAAVLYYMEGCSLSETAGILRIPEGTAKSRLYRARQQLKRELKEYDE